MARRDADIIARCLKGFEAAYRDLYHAHAPRIKAYLLRSGFAHHAADDLTQDVFLRAFRHLRSYDERKGSFATWLGTIARNVVRRQWSRRGPAEAFDAQLAEELLDAAETDNPADAADQAEIYQALRDCIDALGQTHRSAVALRYVDGLTTRGIARQLDLPEATVRLRLNEARAQLLHCLRDKGYQP